MELISASKSLMESVLQISDRGVAEVMYINETLAQGVYLATKKFLRRRRKAEANAGARFKPHLLMNTSKWNLTCLFGQIKKSYEEPETGIWPAYLRRNPKYKTQKKP